MYCRWRMEPPRRRALCWIARPLARCPDKTSGGTKTSGDIASGDITAGDITSGGTKCLEDRTSVKTKRPEGQNVQRQNILLVYFQLIHTKRFVPRMLCLRMFCPHGCLVCRKFLHSGCFVPLTFCPSGRFVPVSYVSGRYVSGHFVWTPLASTQRNIVGQIQ
jgi:hypothetical protein